MFKRGWGRLSLTLMPILALGACASVDTRFAEVTPESVDVDGKTVEVRVIEYDGKEYDVHADRNERGTFGARVQWKHAYTDSAPELHDLYVEASKKALAERCGSETKPFLRAYSPTPWEPFTGSFRCL